MRFLSVLSLCCVIGACSTTQQLPPLRYSKAGGTQETFLKDRFECIERSQQHRSQAYSDRNGGVAYGATIVNARLFTSCMGTRGYAAGPQGTYGAPKGSEVLMLD
jgi:hypothetical protein